MCSVSLEECVWLGKSCELDVSEDCVEIFVKALDDLSELSSFSRVEAS